jgi:hypothetical protein
VAVALTRRASRIGPLAALLFLTAAPAWAQQELTIERQVKLRYLANFGTFIDWPAPAFAAPADPFRLCVAGPDPFGPLLDATMQRETAAGRPIVVERLRPDASAASCHLLYISRLDDARLASLMRSIERKPVLVVGESRRVLELCGGIALILEGDHVRFDVNVAALDARGLKASSQLLRVAREASRRFGNCPH